MIRVTFASDLERIYLTDEAHTIYAEWLKVPAASDGFISGVLADYAEDNFESLVAINKNSKVVSDFIDWLRQRVNCSSNNWL